MAMGWNGLPWRQVLHPHHHVHRPAVLLIHLQDEGKLRSPPDSPLAFVGLKDQARRGALRERGRTSQDEGENHKKEERRLRVRSHNSSPVSPNVAGERRRVSECEPPASTGVLAVMSATSNEDERRRVLGDRLAILPENGVGLEIGVMQKPPELLLIVPAE